jgi:hypothetical protein
MCFRVSDLIPSLPICSQNFLIFLFVSHSIRFYSYLLIWKVSTMNTKSDVLFWKLVENELSSLNASTRSIHHRPIWPWLPWIKRMIDGLYSLIHQSLFPSDIQALKCTIPHSIEPTWFSLAFRFSNCPSPTRLSYATHKMSSLRDFYRIHKSTCMAGDEKSHSKYSYRLRTILRRPTSFLHLPPRAHRRLLSPLPFTPCRIHLQRYVHFLLLPLLLLFCQKSDVIRPENGWEMTFWVMCLLCRFLFVCNSS